jgi:CRISPR/Cas system endoribonuclease Cas6 (RAMP superfamily)
MSFGGLLGEIGYAGELAPFIPWLTLGQWTGIGGKTSFGLGLYNLDFDGDSDLTEGFKPIQATSG